MNKPNCSEVKSIVETYKGKKIKKLEWIDDDTDEVFLVQYYAKGENAKLRWDTIEECRSAIDQDVEEKEIDIKYQTETLKVQEDGDLYTIAHQVKQQRTTAFFVFFLYAALFSYFGGTVGFFAAIILSVINEARIQNFATQAHIAIIQEYQEKRKCLTTN